MTTQYFDDGSTLTYTAEGGYAATPSTEAGYYATYNNPSAVWAPSSVSSGASTWDDVLKFGLSRLIDAKVRPVRPENTVPVWQLGSGYRTGAVTAIPIWLLIVGAVALIALTSK